MNVGNPSKKMIIIIFIIIKLLLFLIGKKFKNKIKIKKVIKGEIFHINILIFEYKLIFLENNLITSENG